ncbi:MAG: 2-phospho-L-lactate guanylyltransferase [Thaumarchaeota archaeon]|nr:2-phospho-L-lactate guanylyltransferase [Nitrososphaerota archaeon]
MTRPAVIIPYKTVGRKSRLTPLLGAERAALFGELLLSGLLRVMDDAAVERDVYVVGSDPNAREISRDAKVGWVAEGADSGVDSAVRKGMSALMNRDSFLVLPSDLPLLDADDVSALLSALSGGFTVICPSSSFNGTNALGFRRNAGSILSYDRNSFWNHLAGAAKFPMKVAVLARRGVVFDVDSPGDLQALAKERINTEAAKFARKALADWGS